MKAPGKDDPNKKPNEWTIMFYFATDNDLAPLIVSQLKGLKDAGYQKDAEVVVRFDPQEKGARTRVYNVNSARKRAKKEKGEKESSIGDSSTFIRNLIEDDVEPSPSPGDKLPERAPAPGNNEPEAKDDLTEFLKYCAEHHRANHYMLFLVGHGMIVGNDAFLPDEQPVSGIKLTDLRTILDDGFYQIAGGKLELLALHSCSMSGIEVAYELQGLASYMMASQGLSFVGSWPYRQLLMKTFKAIDARTEKSHDKNTGRLESPDEIGSLIETLYGLSFYNASDFWLSGYSMDLALCSLDKSKFAGLTERIQQLVIYLKQGLYDDRARELIQLSHLESQSYWAESYTDLYDFCHCLFKKCETTGLQGKIKTACDRVIGKLSPVISDKVGERLKALVVHSRNFGWKYQYSHGLSVYFPWAAPLDDEKTLTEYRNYEFTKTLEENSWLSFLEKYFEKTRRDREKTREEAEISAVNDPTTSIPKAEAVAAAGQNFGVGVGASLAGALPGGPQEEGKVTASTGAACSCPSIKNYHTDLP